MRHEEPERVGRERRDEHDLAGRSRLGVEHVGGLVDVVGAQDELDAAEHLEPLCHVRPLRATQEELPDGRGDIAGLHVSAHGAADADVLEDGPVVAAKLGLCRPAEAQPADLRRLRRHGLVGLACDDQVRHLGWIGSERTVSHAAPPPSPGRPSGRRPSPKYVGSAHRRLHPHRGTRTTALALRRPRDGGVSPSRGPARRGTRALARAACAGRRAFMAGKPGAMPTRSETTAAVGERCSSPARA